MCKGVIYTEDIYLLTAFDRSLVRFMYFPDIHIHIRGESHLKNPSGKRYIKVQTLDNLVIDICNITEIIIDRDCISLFRFLLTILYGLDNYKYYVDDFVESAIENGNREILEILKKKNS